MSLISFRLQTPSQHVQTTLTEASNMADLAGRAEFLKQASRNLMSSKVEARDFHGATHLAKAIPDMSGVDVPSLLRDKALKAVVKKAAKKNEIELARHVASLITDSATKIRAQTENLADK